MDHYMSLIFKDIQNHFVLQIEADCKDFVVEEVNRNHFG
jgi:hypothetical protein